MDVRDPPQEEPKPAVQPKQCTPVTILRFECNAGSKSLIWFGNSSLTALTFNTERWDTDNIHDTGSNTERLTCKTAGRYLIIANIRFEPIALGRRMLSISLNVGATGLGRTETASAAEVIGVRVHV